MSERRVALITGASMGIGEAFADALAARGHDLVLVARSGDALERIAERLRRRDENRAEVIALDLDAADAPERAVAFAYEKFGRVDLLVNNAGFGANGFAEAIPLDTQLGEIRVNVSALVELTARIVPAMLERGSGGIINVASTAAFQPVPYMAVYGATKAFVLSYSEALAEEFAGRGVRVLALCPGATSSNFFARAGQAPSLARFRTPEQVVQTAVRAYNAGAMYVVDGPFNQVSTFFYRLLPRPLMARAAGRIMRPSGAAAPVTRGTPSLEA